MEQATNLSKHTRDRTRSMHHAHKRVRQGPARRGQVACPGMRRGRWMSLKRRRKSRMWHGIASSWRGILPGEVTGGETKMRRCWPHACWGFLGLRQVDRQGDRLKTYIVVVTGGRGTKVSFILKCIWRIYPISEFESEHQNQNTNKIKYSKYLKHNNPIQTVVRHHQFSHWDYLLDNLGLSTGSIVVRLFGLDYYVSNIYCLLLY